ncbi:SDR family NAD(P)-dependent oxidoreductase [Xanthovirga aplysinae]|uniref:SDR family NAD(P)-dependent oxidoreductase n=1 Tax=Xanthovirga aplysinae TaxID=2529853 RepID=UPI0012BD56CB|nr:SDR family NAD(P)-dependent oxidoreductase [Xanthovirga aplysinae]MTI33216.1 SDR family NAD(P)-dependent oxidoreductase [Xanthovirga aplysinae]
MNKSIFITGVGKGLGRALFLYGQKSNYKTYGLLRNIEQFKDLQKDMIPEMGKLILADVGNDDCIDKIHNAVGENKIDLLINNAGIPGKGQKLAEVESDDMMQAFNVHCIGVLRVTKALETNLKKAKSPTVININSRLGSISRQSDGIFKDVPVSYAYRIAKAAQNMLSCCLKNEFEELVNIVALHPGKIKTEIAQKDADIEVDWAAKKIITDWENGQLNKFNGIIDLTEDKIIKW